MLRKFSDVFIVQNVFYQDSTCVPTYGLLSIAPSKVSAPRRCGWRLRRGSKCKCRCSRPRRAPPVGFYVFLFGWMVGPAKHTQNPEMVLKKISDVHQQLDRAWGEECCKYRGSMRKHVLINKLLVRDEDKNKISSCWLCLSRGTGNL